MHSAAKIVFTSSPKMLKAFEYDRRLSLWWKSQGSSDRSMFLDSRNPSCHSEILLHLWSATATAQLHAKLILMGLSTFKLLKNYEWKCIEHAKNSGAMQSILLKHLRGIWPRLKNLRHTRLQLLWQAVVEGPFRQPLSLMQVQRLSMSNIMLATYINTCCMLPVEKIPIALNHSEHLLAIKKTSKFSMKLLDEYNYICFDMFG